MPRSWAWLAASLALLAVPAGGATVQERSVTVTLGADGVVRERVVVRVLLESPDDYDAWSPYPIFLDENRALKRLEASGRTADGAVRRVARKDLDRVAAVARGELHGSGRAQLVSFPAVGVGGELMLDYEVEERPYFPAGRVRLGGEEAIERLRVEVRGGGPGWRYLLAGAGERYRVEEVAGGVVITAADLPAIGVIEQGPAAEGRVPQLRYAWGEAGDWPALGAWYHELTGPVPRHDPAVRRQAQELVAGIEGALERTARLLDFARRQVRYVAVQVGIGGYRPSAPREVLDRRWGDCKDKSFLLLDLLAEAGVEAHPALVLAAADRQVDARFPAADSFNHLIVAVPAAQLGEALPAPLAGGYLFLDPTLTVGGLEWLPPWLQGQQALVVRGSASELVRLPVLPAQELRRLEVTAPLGGPEGDGSARLELAGSAAWLLEERLAARPSDQRPALLEAALAALLPGATVRDARWQAELDGVPRGVLEARVTLASLLATAGGSGPLQLPARAHAPPPRLFEGRALPVVAEPGVYITHLRLTLPRDGCRVATEAVAVDNAAGNFRLAPAVAGRILTVERRTELSERWYEPPLFAELRELALAEHRSAQRRLRLECP